MLELNNIYNLDCREGMRQLDDNSVDLTVTSPPYDNLRTYHDDNFAWNFGIFTEVADELYRVTKPGGVVVWVVGDAVIDGSETGSSFRQALYFKEIGFKIHDTMIYEKNSSTFPAKFTSKRYSQVFEYMFILVKGKKIRDDIKLIADKRNKWAGWTNWGNKTQFDREGNLNQEKSNKPTPEFSLRNNIWKYTVSFNDKTGHPAVFPEKLAEDHILSWSKEGDVVLDPFMGSGTTAKMAMMNNRKYIGFENNSDYYEVSLKRVGKYVGKVNDNISSVDVKDSDGAVESLQLNTANDSEEEGKTEIFNEIVGQLNDYLNTMSLGILKNLKLTFANKANDRRVENVLRERGLLSGETQNPPLYCEGAKGPQEVGDWTKMEQGHTEVSNDAPTTGTSILDRFIGNGRMDAEIEEDSINAPEPQKDERARGFTLDENFIKKMIIDTINEQTASGGIIFGAIMDAISQNETDKVTPPDIDFVPSENFDWDTPIWSELPVPEWSGELPEPAKKRRGRPKGSKNKPKLEI